MPTCKLSKFTSVNSLKELGTFFNASSLDSYWLMETSAIKSPDIKFKIYVPNMSPLVAKIPGPAASCGKVIIPAPTVLLVINNAALPIGTIESMILVFEVDFL